MNKISLAILIPLFSILASCDAPSVVNDNVQKELNNKKVRHISHEDEELFGLIFSEELIKETFSEGENQEKIDSINNLEGISLQYISRENINSQPSIIAEQLDMFNYDFERGLDLVASGNYFSSAKPYFYYSTKAITKNGIVAGFWLLKVEPTTVRQHLPEA